MTLLRAGPFAPTDGRRCPMEPLPEVRAADPEDSRRSVLHAPGRWDGALPRRRSCAPGCSTERRRLAKFSLQTGAPTEASLRGSRRCPARALRNALRNRSGLAPTARTWRGVRASRTAAPPRLTSPCGAEFRARRYGLGQSGGGAALGAGALVGARVVAAGAAGRGSVGSVQGSLCGGGLSRCQEGNPGAWGSSGRFAVRVQPRQSGTELSCGAPGVRRGPARTAQLRAAAARAALGVCGAAEEGEGRRRSPSQSSVVWGTAPVPRGRSSDSGSVLLGRVLGCCSCTKKASRTGTDALGASWLLLGSQGCRGSGGARLPAVSFRGWSDGSGRIRWGRLTLGTSFLCIFVSLIV